MYMRAFEPISTSVQAEIISSSKTDTVYVFVTVTEPVQVVCERASIDKRGSGSDDSKEPPS